MFLNTFMKQPYSSTLSPSSKCSDSTQPCPFLYLAPHSQFLPPHLPLPAAYPSRDLRGALLTMTTLDRPIAAALPSIESTAAPDCGLAAPGSDLASESNCIRSKTFI